jgi:putative hemolysin
MSAIAGEVLVIVLLLVVNGLLAMSEIAVVAARRGWLEQRAAAGSPGALAALTLLREPTRFFSTVQVGITLIGILAGAFGGATIAEQLTRRLAMVPGLESYSEAIALGLVVICITYLSLIIGELVPKRLAMRRPEPIAVLVARPLTLLARVAAPLVTLLSRSTQAVLHLLRVQDIVKPSVTEEEIRAVIDEGRAAGVLAPSEHEMVEGVLQLGEAKVDRFMTPRTDLDWIDLNDDPEAIRRELAGAGRARIVACRGSIENVLGVVRAEDVLAQLLRNEPLDLTRVMRPALFVPATTLAVDLLDRFRRSHEDTALVLDEFGGVDGVVTMADLVEEIVGDLRPVSRAEEPVVQRPEGGWLVDGSVPLGDLADLLGKAVPAVPGVHTVGGAVMALLGHVPKVGEHIEDGGFRYEVVDMDGRRIDKLLVSRSLPPGGEGEV